MLSKQLLFRRWSCPISVCELARLVSDSRTMTKDLNFVSWGILSCPDYLCLAFLSSPLIPVRQIRLRGTQLLPRRLHMILKANSGRSSLACLSIVMALAHWLNFLCRRISPVYKITKIVRTLWLAERRVCMRVCKHGCHVTLSVFPRHNLKPFQSG